MKAMMAPVYVLAMDAAEWVQARCLGVQGPAAMRLQERTFTVLESVTLALVFRDGRRDHLRSANEALWGARLSARLLRHQGALSQRQSEYLHGRLDEIGRMVGAWQRQLSHGGRRPGARRRGEDAASRGGAPSTAPTA